MRRRAERLYEQLDMLQHLRQQARRELLAESRKHAITAKLRQIHIWERWRFSAATTRRKDGGGRSSREIEAQRESCLACLILKVVNWRSSSPRMAMFSMSSSKVRLAGSPGYFGCFHVVPPHDDLYKFPTTRTWTSTKTKASPEAQTTTTAFG